MGIFDGVLLASDFDNTLIYTEAALRTGAPVPELSEKNRAALERFMAEGVDGLLRDKTRPPGTPPRTGAPSDLPRPGREAARARKPQGVLQEVSERDTKSAR